MLLLAVLVLLVRDRFHPCHVLALRIVPGNRHLNHSLVGSCAMEMFDAFRTYNHIAFFQDAHWFSIDARTAFSFNNDQNLSGRVCVPERSGAWFKNYICTGYRHPGNRFRQRDDLDFTGKYLVASFNALDGIAPGICSSAATADPITNREERRAEMSFNMMVTYIQSIDRKLLRKLALMAQ